MIVQQELIFNGTPKQFAVTIQTYMGRLHDNLPYLPFDPKNVKDILFVRHSDPKQQPNQYLNVTVQSLPNNKSMIIVSGEEEAWAISEPWWDSFQMELNRQGWLESKISRDLDLEDIMHRIDEMRRDLGDKVDDLKRGQTAIYHRIGSEAQRTLDAVLSEVRQDRIEQDQLQRTIDSIRLALKYIQVEGLTVNDEGLKKSLDDIYQAINSDLTFRQKLELSLPIIPVLLAYKIELGASIDLKAVWKELKELVGRA